jgi:hypothetical protein
VLSLAVIFLPPCPQGPCQKGVYQSITWNSFFFLSCLQNRITHQGQFLVSYNTQEVPLITDTEVWLWPYTLHCADIFSRGNSGASSGKHLQFLNGQFQAGEFKRQPNRVLMPCKIIMKDIYEKKKIPVHLKARAHTPSCDSRWMASSTNPGLLSDSDLSPWSSEIVRAPFNLVNVQNQCLSF